MDRTYSPPTPLGSVPAREDTDAGLSARIFLIAMTLGALLRLIAVIWGGLSPGGDGLGRLANAVSWAERPRWQGLSGVWRPLHWYVLGVLIRLWDQPILWAKVINFSCGIGSLIVLRKSVQATFGPLVATLSALLLAIYWTHISLTSSYWVEIPYLFFVLLAVHYASKAVSTINPRAAFLSGLFLTVAILLRHEGTLVLGLFLVWFAVSTKNRKLLLWFALLPVCAAGWALLEPMLTGGSFLDYVAAAKGIKAGENQLQGFTLRDCLYQWVIMPASVPSLFVIIPGFYGLWKARRTAYRDLFAWMLIAQVVFYFSMTITSAWRPQLRYILLYFVNLFPYAAWTWSQWLRRFPARAVLATLMVGMILTQSAAWWVGRNNYLSMGWLPLQMDTAPQKALDEWASKIKAADQREIKLVSFVHGAMSAAWSLPHSLVLYRFPINNSQEYYLGDSPQILQGELPPLVYAADVVLIDPQSEFYTKCCNLLKERCPDVQIKAVHSRIAALLLSPRARSIFVNDE
jgi:hypothetical protein